MRLTTLLARLLAATLLTVWTCQLTLHSPAEVSSTAPDPTDEVGMKITNTSARIVHLNLSDGAVMLPPLQTIELHAKQAADAKAVLDGTLRPLVDDGSLVVDGAGPMPAGETLLSAAAACAPSPTSADPGPDTPESTTQHSPGTRRRS
jgi:hypothetical protein